ncbi:MAG: HRDC domain-containing protein [Chthoniobacterales bacterium]|nr:HRDC domain-containing protein [Chthoniobacterales bacterium]
MIADQTSYEEFLSFLETQTEIALDTEADSLHCYFEKLCLIQVGASEQFSLIDPLVQLPLTQFFSALEGKRLIFHDADYDLRLLRRSGSFPDQSIFDTMLAARLCGEPRLGLAALVEKYFDVSLSKASRKANWGQRPLSSQMLEYALNDVRYLSGLVSIFEEKLHELGRLEWFYQSCNRMVHATRAIRVKEEDHLWRLSGYVALPPQSWAVLKALWWWRDGEARKCDKPSFYIMSHEEMLSIAEKAPQGKKWELRKLPKAREEEIEQIIVAALQLKEEEWPQALPRIKNHMNKDEQHRFQKLQQQRDRVAQKIALDPSVIASKNAMEAAARDKNTPLLLPWQRELLGIGLS